MGQRANLILAEKGTYRLFYSHWCANTLPRDLFWGAEHAASFIRIQREVGVSDWLDDVWAEGGAALDFDRKRFLLYGGEDILYDVPLRRVYLQLLAPVWSGWDVRWAYEGIADLADSVGYPRERVLSKGGEESTDGTLAAPSQMDWTDLVASIRFDDGTIRLYPLVDDVASHLSAGPKLADEARASDGLPQFFLDEWTTAFPSGGGFHLDIPAKRLDYWTAREAPGIPERVAKGWPGWEICWHHDRYESQLERAEGHLRFPLPDRRSLLAHCRQMLLREPTKSPVGEVRAFADHEREQGKAVSVNLWALRDDRLELSTEDRRTILDNAIRSVSD